MLPQGRGMPKREREQGVGWEVHVSGRRKYSCAPLLPTGQVSFRWETKPRAPLSAGRDWPQWPVVIPTQSTGQPWSQAGSLSRSDGPLEHARVGVHWWCKEISSPQGQGGAADRSWYTCMRARSSLTRCWLLSPASKVIQYSSALCVQN